MPGMSKRYREDREVSVDRIKSAEQIGRLVFDLAKTLANSSACSKPSPAARVAVRSQSDAVSNLMPRLGRGCRSTQNGHAEKTQSMSLFGVKRTCRIAPHMSAFDPKRTSSNQLTCAGFSGRRCYSTTSIAYKPRWRCEFTQTEAPTYVESIT